MNVPIIASSLSVHEEQLADYRAKLLFEANNVGALVECVNKVLNGEILIHAYDYQRNVNHFAQKFMTTIESIIN